MTRPARLVVRQLCVPRKEINAMATKWRSVSEGGDLLKWAGLAAGYELEGAWLGTKPGKFGPLGLLQPDNEDPVITFTMPYKLESKLRKVAEGTRVRIVYMGMVPAGDGKTLYNFDVQVPDDGTPDAADEEPF